MQGKNVNINDLYDFNKLKKFIEDCSLEELILFSYEYNKIKLKLPEASAENIKKYAYKTGAGLFCNDLTGPAFVLNTIYDLKTNIKEYDLLYNMLQDNISKKTLISYMLFRIFVDKKYIKDCYIGSTQYFDLVLFPTEKDEVFVDGGCFDGKDSENFIKLYGHDYKTIYTYEPSVENYNNVVERLANQSRVINRNFGISDKTESKFFTSYMPESANRVHDNWGDIEIKVTTIDDDIKEKITFLKLDIEGYEKQGIEGAKEHIKNDNPKMALCLYHTVEDIWKIPRMISEISSDYYYNIRQHDKDQPWELVLYCTPKRLANKDSNLTEIKWADIDKLIKSIDKTFSMIKQQIAMPKTNYSVLSSFTKSIMSGLSAANNNFKLVDEDDAHKAAVRYRDVEDKLLQLKILFAQNKHDSADILLEEIMSLYSEWKQATKKSCNR